MRTLIVIAVASISLTVAYGQDQKQIAQSASKQYQVSVTENLNVTDKIVLSSESTTVRVADPNETVGVNGRVMRVADLVAVLSADNVLEQRLHNQGNQIPSTSQPTPPLEKKH